MTRVTKINRLEMKGFKSFNKKTQVDFDDGFNCVLGPNGAGKSNVFDALVFVLGKSGSKGMRAEKTANLIYNGGKMKSPAKQGEVAIFFDNKNDIFATGTEELEVRRVVKASGSSKYVINGETRTRQQVLDLFSRAKIEPDGHNIVLQGDIVHLVEMSPLERRGMVEEIAGISIYEDKKGKALRELSRVEDKLNEADIILTERKSYLRELKKERDQALKFKDLDEKIKRNKATLLNMHMKSKSDSIGKFDKQIKEHEDKVAKFQKDIELAQDKVASRKKEADDINKEIEEKGEKEQVAMHKQVEQLRVDLAVKEQRSHTVKTEVQKLRDRKEELSKNKREIEARVKEIDGERLSVDKRIGQREDKVKELEKKISVHRKKNNLEDAQDVDKRVEEIDKEADSIQETIQSLREEQQKVLREKDSIEVKLQGMDEKIEKVLSMESENKEALDKLKNDKKRLKFVSEELNEKLVRDSDIASELATARTKLDLKREELSKLQAQSASIREGIAGGDAVQAILGLGKAGIYGTVSELGKADKEFALALEIAAGARINSIVVESDEVAAKCIDHLKKNKLGVATFLPLNKLKSPIIKTEVRSKSGSGIQGLALDLVDYDKKFEKAFQYVFGNTLVVDDIGVARKVGIGFTRMVTRTGDLVEASGAMQGGHRKKARGLGFQDKEIDGKIQFLGAEVEDLDSVVKNLVSERDELAKSVEKLRSEKAELDGNVIKIEKSLHLDSADLEATKEQKAKFTIETDSLESNLGKVQDDIVVNTKRLTVLKVERQKLREQLSGLRNPAVLAELNSFEEKKNELLSEIAGIKGESKGFNSEIDNVLMPEIESIQKIIKQQDKEEQAFKSEGQTLESDIKKFSKDLKEMEEKEKKFYSKFKALFEKRQKIGEETTKLEGDILAKNDKIRESEGKKNAVSLENARLKAELAGLEEEFKQFENVSLYRNKEEDEIKKEVNEFERLASSIGAVNMKALEIYDQIENEYDKLQEKKSMLTGEREDVLVMINKIDSRKKELFMKTFEILDKNFKRIFSAISTKAREAVLELEDKKDPFNGGVNIRVKISGKKYLDIRSLSGGEKTLTALAFIFAVQEYEPAPFYILDEVDAALDKRNSEKLANFLLSYSGKAQYIIISHNDALISEADNLYGVSMNEHGESKVTSLKI